MIQSRRILVSLALILATAALCVVGLEAMRENESRRAKAATQPTRDEGVRIQVESVVRRVVPFNVQATGFLVPFEELIVAAQVPGFVAIQRVEAGDRVEEGDTLFQIDDALRTLDLRKAQAEVERAQADLTLAEENFRRIERLEDQESANPMEVLRDRTALETARAILKQSEAARRETEELLRKSTINAPISGYVAAVHTRQGEYAHVGQPLAEVIDTDRVKLVVQLNEREIVHCAVGDPAVITSPALPGQRFEGNMLRIPPRAALDSRKFDIEIVLENRDQRLRPGFFVAASVAPADTRDDQSVLVIPRTAVFESYRRLYCFVVESEHDEDRARLTLIEAAPLLADPKLVRILQGLNEGDRVITKGLQHVTDDTLVNIEKP